MQQGGLPVRAWKGNAWERVRETLRRTSREVREMSEFLCLAVAILGFAGVVVTVCVIDLFVRVSRLEDREMYPRLSPSIYDLDEGKHGRKRNGHF